jgi:hypothetical protein
MIPVRWISLATLGLAFVVYLVAPFVPIKANDGITYGEMLQAAASLIGAVLGVLGVFMFTRWSLERAERDKQEHRFELARLTMNSIVDFVKQLHHWSKAFDKLDGTVKGLRNFQATMDQFVEEKIRPSQVLRDELVASYPVLEVALHAIDINYDKFQAFLKQALDAPDDSAAFSAKLHMAIKHLVSVVRFLESIAQEFEASQSRIGRSGLHKGLANQLALLAASARILAARTNNSRFLP